MIKRILGYLPLLALVACEGTIEIRKKSANQLKLEAAKICSGEVVSGIAGEANCYGSVSGGVYVLSSRNDIASVGDWDDPDFLTNLIDGVIDRNQSVLSLDDINKNSNPIDLFKTKYQTIPNPVTDSDGRYDANGAIPKQHYLERIVGRPDQECGTSGSITERINDCSTKNGAKAFYNGLQYGQAAEGDWKLVTLDSNGAEVWRDERTRLLWSDKTYYRYNWYEASGYSKPEELSHIESWYNSEPGMSNNCNNGPCQQTNPISICAEVNDSGVVIGGGAYPDYDGEYTPTVDIENEFKGSLNASNDVIWKLPSISDWKLADVNGIRKVLPNMDHEFWSSSSNSGHRSGALLFLGWDGISRTNERNRTNIFVRCVGLSRD